MDNLNAIYKHLWDNLQHFKEETQGYQKLEKRQRAMTQGQSWFLRELLQKPTE